MKDNKTKSSKFELVKGSKILNSAYTLLHKLGAGNFGEVYLARKSPLLKDESYDRYPNQVSVKIEKPGQQQESFELNHEGRVMRQITSNAEVEGFPQFITEGMEGGNKYIVTELLGPNLEILLGLCGGKFSMKTTIMLMFQVFERLEHVHSSGYLYCDIKPENFLMGINDKSHILYIIDFGLCKRYRNAQTQLHQPYKEQQKFHGTLRYASIGSQLGISQSRRDDLESACYLMVYLLKGTLPWQGYTVSTGETKENWILTQKLKHSVESICEGLPIEIINIMEYCQELEYYEEPDYIYITSELRDIYIRLGYVLDYAYDWMLFPQETKYRSGTTTVRIQKIIKQ